LSRTSPPTILNGMQLSDANRARRQCKSSSPKETKKPGKRHAFSSPPDGTKRRGRPPNQTIVKIMHKRGCSRSEAYRVLDEQKLRRRTKRERLLDETRRFSSLIKTTDTWDFTTVHYPRIDDATTYGYIPGDLYANCLFYFAKHGDLVIAPMAGSGQIMRVYEDRAVWTKGLPQPWDIDLRMNDLTPRGPYAALIGQHDLRHGFPKLERAPDFVVMDVPYLGICRRQYSNRDDDLANMDEPEWIDAMHRIARSCAEAAAKRCTIITPTWVDFRRWQPVLCPEIVRDAWRGVGYRLIRVCYSSRKIQQRPMARWNNLARENRVPIADTAEVLTFDRIE
jgi:ParB family chromosome partitioning protein